jgi:hypothetical protein
MLSKLGELHNFFGTYRMGTPLRGCKALSICTNVLGIVRLFAFEELFMSTF